MNEPIVSPWLIYWAGRIDMIQGICCIVGIIVTIYAMFVALAAMTAFNSNDKDVKVYAAEHITPANIKATGEFTDKAVDKLIEKISKASKAIKE